MTSESKKDKIILETTPTGVVYSVIDHAVKFESTQRVCVICGKQLKRGQRALGIITNCPQTLMKNDMPGNFFIHARCSGACQEDKINSELLSKRIDNVITEYQTVVSFISNYKDRWGIKLFRYGDD